MGSVDPSYPPTCDKVGICLYIVLLTEVVGGVGRDIVSPTKKEDGAQSEFIGIDYSYYIYLRFKTRPFRPAWRINPC